MEVEIVEIDGIKILFIDGVLIKTHIEEAEIDEYKEKNKQSKTI